MDLFDRINKLKEEGLDQIKQAKNQKMLDKIRVELMGRKGELTQILHSMKDIAPENRPKVGQEVNQVRDILQKQLDEAKDHFLQAVIAQKLEEEKNNHFEVKEDDSVEVDGKVLDSKKILVLSAGGGTSGLLANALAKGAKEEGIPLVTAAGSYGAHLDIMDDYDLVILAPQVASYYEDLKKDADRMGVKCIACEGKQYIDLTRNPKGALEFVFKIMGE